ncbi:diaminopimelate epimerase [Halomonas denitrificans]|nr:diaminopimelate epimerase [Halomonas denitrificans]
MTDAKPGPSLLAFVKLEGLGNDFLLVDSRPGGPALSPDLIRRLADRRLGVGFDQLLRIQPPRSGHAFDVVIHNADGSPAEQCGNGMRALAAWLDARGELPQGGLDIGTPAGRVRLARADAADGASAWSAELPGLELGPGDATRRDVRLGNPHRVLTIDRPPDPERLEDARRAQPDAAELNLGIAYVRDPHRIELRVHERGAGPTPACGSGACAAAAALIDAGAVESPVRVEQPGGIVVVDWIPGESRVRLTGPARVVFEGTIAWPTAATNPDPTP